MRYHWCLCTGVLISRFGVIVDVTAILLAATPDKIYRSIKRNDFRIFRHTRHIPRLMLIYGEILEHGIWNMTLSMNMLCKDQIQHQKS